MPDTDEFAGVFDEIPESLVKSVLEQSGFKDTLEQPAEPIEPPAEPTEEITEEPIPAAPGGPLFREDEEVVTLPDGSQYPVALVKQWAERANQPTPPPEPFFQPPTVPTLEEPQQPFYPPLPQLTEEDLELAGPAVKALLIIANAQANEMRDLRSQISKAQEIQQHNADVEASKFINAATSAFKQEYNLPDELMAQIVSNAAADDAARHIRQHKDPYEAVKYALTRSYWDLPQARQFEFERQAAVRQAAQVRKQKLAGVGGSNGPSTRNQPAYDENTPEGRHQAAVDLVRQAMYGDES